MTGVQTCALPIFYNCGFSPTSNTFYATDTFFAGNSQITSLGVGTSASGVLGEILAANNITAYYSDERLKNKLGNIESALNKLISLDGFYYQANETAQNIATKINSVTANFGLLITANTGSTPVVLDLTSSFGSTIDPVNSGFEINYNPVKIGRAHV